MPKSTWNGLKGILYELPNAQADLERAKADKIRAEAYEIRARVNLVRNNPTVDLNNLDPKSAKESHLLAEFLRYSGYSNQQIITIINSKSAPKILAAVSEIFLLWLEGKIELHTHDDQSEDLEEK